jgi:apolipoprotein N-acyltransferase
VFPRDFLDFAREGAELFVLETNNASFEHSYASQQHVAHTRMRALETRQWVVQAALAGISASIAPDGTISHTTDLFTTEGFVTDVRTRGPSSLYTRTGDLFPALFATTAALVALWRVSRARRHTMSAGPKEAVEH